MIPITIPPHVDVDPRVRAVADRHRFQLVDAGDFDATYDLLAGHFGPEGEIEPRETLRAELAAPRWYGDVAVVYQLVRIVDAEGGVVAVADGRFAIGPSAMLGLGSNFLTQPDKRGEGVAAAVDVSSRRAFVAHAAALVGRSPELPCLVMADVDALDPERPESLARLRLWARCGWTVLPPRALPFALLGQEDPERPGALLGPVPNLLMVRGGEVRRRDALSRAEVAVSIDLLAAISAGLAPADQVAAWADTARDALAAWPGDAIPTLPLPARDATADDLAPLLRGALLRSVPDSWERGDVPDPGSERAALERLLDAPRR